LCTIQFAQVAVDGAERQMTGLSGDFEKETIREAKDRSRPEGLERCGHDIVVLEDQIVVVQEPLDGPVNLYGITLVDGPPRLSSQLASRRIAGASDSGRVEGRDPGPYPKETCAPLTRTSWSAFWPATIPSRSESPMNSWQRARGSRCSH
jgi:hypothetical protein